MRRCVTSPRQCLGIAESRTGLPAIHPQPLRSQRRFHNNRRRPLATHVHQRLAKASHEPVVSEAWIGPGFCCDWTRGLSVGTADAMENTEANNRNALILNWILGYLSGSAIGSSGKYDPLRHVSSAAVAGWLDHYCSSHSRAGIGTVAWDLVHELCFVS